ncbi:MAG TPA: glycerate kinase, partial [Tepidisphaeraceae bacterium]
LSVGSGGPKLAAPKLLPGPSAAGGPHAPLLDGRAIEFVVACDVGNPLYGPDGAACVFAPQKGASPDAVAQLDADLRRFATRIARVDLAAAPAAGAAGGVGFAMMAFFGARVASGADLIAGLTNLDARVAAADLVITGEGRLDAQTLQGKGPLAVMRAAKRHGKPCVALAGQIAADAVGFADEGATATFSLMTGVMTLAESSDRAAELLARVAEQSTRLFCWHPRSIDV